MRYLLASMALFAITAAPLHADSFDAPPPSPSSQSQSGPTSTDSQKQPKKPEIIHRDGQIDAQGNPVDTPPPQGEVNPLNQGMPSQGAMMLKSPEQINFLTVMSGTNSSQWPGLVKKERHILNSEFVDVMTARSNESFRLALVHKSDEDKAGTFVDQAFRYSLLSDLVARQIGKPATCRMQLAQRFYDMRLYSMALSICRNILVMERDDLEANTMAGDIELKVGDYFMALRNYQMVTRLNPKNDVAWTAIGEVYMLMGNTPKAREALRRGIELGNKKAPQLLAKMDNPRQIAPPSDKPAAGVPASGVDLVKDGREAMKLGRIDEARGIFEAAIKQDPNNAAAHFALGDWYFRESQFYQAIDEYNKASKLSPKDPEPLYYMGLVCEIVYDKMGSDIHLDRAIECMHGALQLNKGYTRAREAQERLLNKKMSIAN